MADYYVSSTLTLSPQSNLVTYNNSPLFQRRSSIRRGTIASISKDIRVNDVTEIIKTQKALQQQERIMNDTQSLMLRRRHSMMNMSNRVLQPKKQLPSRERTLSIGDLKAKINTDNQQQGDYTTATEQVSAKLRLDERMIKGSTQQQDTTILNHLRKCAACISQQQQQQQGDDDILPTESTSSHRSVMPSMSSNNSSSSSASSTPSLQNTSLHHEIIKNLNCGITNYSHQIQDLISQPIEKKQQQIQECKALIVQQQQLLNQLEALMANEGNIEPSISSNSIRTSSTTEPKKQPSNLLLGSLFSTPKASTTQVIIRQKPDKQEADTIFSVQGVCTTVESSYIPDQLLSNKENLEEDKKNGVYQYHYSLNLTFEDRQEKFTLKPQEEWEKDSQVHVCQDEHCKNKFSWLQRKHHCRGCGHIYCNTHSGNRLPLFTKNASADKPTFSRVCDHCFFNLAGDTLEAL